MLGALRPTHHAILPHQHTLVQRVAATGSGSFPPLSHPANTPVPQNYLPEVSAPTPPSRSDRPAQQRTTRLPPDRLDRCASHRDLGPGTRPRSYPSRVIRRRPLGNGDRTPRPIR